MTTRSSTEVWLIGQQTEKLFANKLPSKKEAVSLLMNYKKNIKLPFRDALNSSIDDIMEVWQKAGIPTTQKYNAVKKLNKLYEEWQGLKKGKGKKKHFQ